MSFARARVAPPTWSPGITGSPRSGPWPDHRATPYVGPSSDPRGKGRHGGDDRLGNPRHRQDRDAASRRDLREVPGARIAAVGSRTTGSAEAFAEEYGGPDCRAHASYADLVADPDVDVVYVATPHALHLDNARLALEAGKHVLCEKPLTLNTAEAEEMIGSPASTTAS